MQRFLIGLCVILACSLMGPAQSFWHGGPTSSPPSSCPVNGPTLPGLSCDSNGFTIFTVGSTGGSTPCLGCFGEGTSYSTNGGTRIIYVSQSRGCDFNGTTCLNDGSFSQPSATPNFGLGELRHDQPDWLLMACGDTWTEQSVGGITIAGYGTGAPLLFSSYDPSAGHNPPVPNPPGCTRPLMQISSTWGQGAIGTSGGGFEFPNYIAWAGLDFYAYKRDYTNMATFSLTEAMNSGIAGFGTIETVTDMLVEDCGFGYFISSSGAGFGTWQWNDNLFIRRTRIYGTYLNSANPEGYGLGISQVGNGPSGYVIFENLIDFDWGNEGDSGNINWTSSLPGIFTHNLYLSPTTGQAQGLPENVGTPYTVVGNIFSNDGSESQFRLSGIVTGNSFIQNPSDIPTQSSTAFASDFSGNVMVNGIDPACNIGGCVIEEAFGVAGRDIHGFDYNNAATLALSHNFMVNSPGTVAATGVELRSGTFGVTVNGNAIYNFGIGGGSAVSQFIGGLRAYTITNGGSGYTDNSVPFTAEQSYTNFKGSDPSNNWPNNIVITVSSGSATHIPSTGICAYDDGGGIKGPLSCSEQDGTHWIISGTNFVSTHSGTLYLPYIATTVSCVSCANGVSVVAGSAEILSAGGTIIAISNAGADSTVFGSLPDDAGQNYSVGDTITVANGAHCWVNAAVCPSGFPSGGSNFQATLASVATNTVSSSGCNLASNNIIDPTGANVLGCSGSVYVDPNRTAGSYYASLSAHSPVANATMTASIDAGGVLHVTAISGTLNIGDAIKFSGQTKADYIKGDNAGTSSGGTGHSPALCNVAPNNANCTGTGGTGTYALSRINVSVGSGSMSSYTATQLIGLMRKNAKQNWDTNLTACKFNTYIKNGFGFTDTCTP